MKLAEVQRDALQLPDAERAALAAELLGSLPAILWEEDSGVAEAQRRLAEMAQDPSVGRSWEQIRASLGR
jgi:putative addiction module component (TIGR02574 family)